jgi:hypothetical protein
VLPPSDFCTNTAWTTSTRHKGRREKKEWPADCCCTRARSQLMQRLCRLRQNVD